ncbi:MAG: molybdenum transporter, periplasmic molybdate-binding protein, partial [Ramlibacter sp.]|nr:molybdenum transporter, periplasmic molybdate-binding protein [Ramlibacter sp.]
MRKRGFLTLLAASAAAASAAGVVAAGAARSPRAPVRVAAASDLKFALAELAEQYRRQSGQSVELNLGSSGQFAQQIRQGLPVDLYLSAEEDFVFQLFAAGLVQGRGALYALGRIAALVPAGSTVPLDARLSGLRESWAQVKHFAIANPQHAPYGRAARQALERLGLWEMARAKLVLGENIAQATQFVTSGAAQAGITALSLALAPEVGRLARHLVLPAHLHEPLRQRMVLLNGARPGAENFYSFLQGPAARQVFERFGFAAG